jgi:signal transduction histidine kinase
MVLALLGQSLDTAGAAEDALKSACDAVAAAVRSPAAMVHLGDQGSAVPDGAISVPLQAEGSVVGTLVVAPRRPGEPYSRREIDLITTMASTLAQVARAVGLAGALEAARREISVQRLDERRRLRRDLHDGLGPLLASLGLRLDALERAAPAPLAGEVATLKDVVATSRREVRRLVDGLGVEDAVRLVDLERALAELVDGWASATAPLGLHLELAVVGKIPTLSPYVRTTAYRIAGEAITNVVRHARATSCVVRLAQFEEQGMVLEVHDNGVGLGRSRPGVGLRSMHERADAVGGLLETAGHPDGGTVVRLTLVDAAAGAPG